MKLLSCIGEFMRHEKLVNGLLALVYLFFMARFGADFFENGRLSSLFNMLFQSVVAAAFFFRRPPQLVSWDVADWLFALTGSIAPMLMTPTGAPPQYGWLTVQIIGICFSMAGMASINRSFGVVAANRGVKTAGMFGLVRHPIYASYLITDGAILAQNWSVPNVTLMAVAVVAQVARIRCEEKLLMQDPAYQAHAMKVRWRVLPGVW